MFNQSFITLVAAQIFLVDSPDELPYYVVKVGKYVTEFENVPEMDAWLFNNFLLPYWIDEDDDRPELKHCIWMDSLDDDSRILEMVKNGSRMNSAKTLGLEPMNFAKLANNEKQLCA